jgi:redox-sensitive bicupin YhaK (pirin superfamily)
LRIVEDEEMGRTDRRAPDRLRPTSFPRYVRAMLHLEEAKRFGPSLVAAPSGPPQALRTIGPFAAVAYHTPIEVAPLALAVDRDLRPHPHIGLVAISYSWHGHITHRDSLGSTSELAPGAIHSMIAGRGVVHSERFERLRVLGGRLESFQLLLALPERDEDMDPEFAQVPADAVPQRVAADRTVRLLLGPGAHPGIRFPGAAFLHDVQLAAGGRYELSHGYSQQAVFVISGRLDSTGVSIGAEQVAHADAAGCVFTAKEPTRMLAFGGEPVGPRFMWWNFIHSSLDRIEAARARWREAPWGLPPGDTESFSPAPADSGRPLYRLNAGS